MRKNDSVKGCDVSEKNNKQFNKCNIFTGKVFLIKIFRWKDFVFSPIQRFSPNVVLEFNCGSKVKLGRMVRVHSGTKIKVEN